MLWRVCLQPYVWCRVKKLSSNVLKSSTMPYYAVAKGRKAGIFMTWPDCEDQVKGFPGARYKKFNTITEADDFISAINSSHGPTTSKPNKSNINSSIVSNHSQLKSLKRSFNTSTAHQKKSNVEVPKKKSRTKRNSYSDESEASDESDDLNTVICKQMDDIEKRLQGFQKGVDKIIKKNTVKTGRKSILIEQCDTKPEGFIQDKDGFVQVYTDGSCTSNGRKGAKAGIGVYWNDNHPQNQSEPVSGRATNNCGEIQAASCAIKIALQNGINKLTINTDSQFLINSVTKWMPAWKRKGWKLKSGEPVKNEIDFKELDLLQNQLQIRWNHVDAHRGLHGNEMADQLAKVGAAKYDK